MALELISAPPSSFSLYARALLSAVKRGQKPVLPELTIAIEHAATDRRRFRAYNELCSFRDSDVMPATWPHVLAFPLRMALLGDTRFPFPLLGLVHLKNEIVQERPIGLVELLRIECGFGTIEPHDKGIAFTLISRASVSGEQVWREESTILYRTRERLPGGARVDEDDRPVEQATHSATWSLPANLGRRYGRVSGDLNPIHLHPLSARMFGFERAVAHGMWSAARGLSTTLPDPDVPLTYRVWFKLPIFLPATVSYQKEGSGEHLRFELCDREGVKPHVRGQLSIGGIPEP